MAATGDAVDLFVPGRLCLLGGQSVSLATGMQQKAQISPCTAEHSDWAGTFRQSHPSIPPGRALVIGTQQGLYARARRLPARKLVLISTSPPPGHQQHHGSSSSAAPAAAAAKPLRLEVEMEPAALSKVASKGGFFSYGAGVAYEVLIHHEIEGGLEIDNFRTTLPIKRGLSSSAAYCVLVVRAFNRLFNLRLTTRGEMDLAYRGELQTPSRCGRLDQCCAYGPTLVDAVFDGLRLHTAPVSPAVPLHFVVVDLQKGKDTKRILADLNTCYPVPTTAVARGLHLLLGPINQEILATTLDLVAGRLSYSSSSSSSSIPAPGSSAAVSSSSSPSDTSHPTGHGDDGNPSSPTREGGATEGVAKEEAEEVEEEDGRSAEALALAVTSPRIAVGLGVPPAPPRSSSSCSSSSSSSPFSSSSLSSVSETAISAEEEDTPSLLLLSQCRTELASVRASVALSIPERLGRLMRLAQRCFDALAAPACPTELKAPALHALLEHPGLQGLIFGGKGVGSGGDGSAQLLARSAEAQAELIGVITEELRLPAFAVTVQGTAR